MEKYPRGRRGSPAKGVVRETVARVQIPPSPPTVSNQNHKVCIAHFYFTNNNLIAKYVILLLTLDELN